MSRFAPYEIPENLLEPPPEHPFLTWVSDHRQLLIASTPCVVVAVAWFWVLFMVTQTRHTRVEQYLATAKQDEAQGNYSEARLCLDRVIRLGSGTDVVLIELAGVLRQLGQEGRASGLMATLAPLEQDQPGSEAAHLVMAMNFLNGPQVTESNLFDAELHLRRALAENESSVEAHAMLGKICAQTGRYTEARQHYLVIIKKRPDLLRPLAEVLRAEGDESAAGSRAREALKHFESRSEDYPDDENSRLLAADAAVFLGEYPRAERLLLRGLYLEESEKLHQALAITYGEWAKSFWKKSDDVPREAIVLLEKGLRQDSQNPVIREAFSTLLKRYEPVANRVRSVLEGLTAEPETAGVALFLLGSDDWHHQRTTEARARLEKAHELAPKSLDVLNNLAQVLASEPKADLPRALEMANLALELSPESLVYLETRGCILAQMGRWKEAVADLEAAMPAAGNRAEPHFEISRAYEALGLTELAARHRARAESLEAEAVTDADSDEP